MRVAPFLSSPLSSPLPYLRRRGQGGHRRHGLGLGLLGLALLLGGHHGKQGVGRGGRGLCVCLGEEGSASMKKSVHRAGKEFALAPPAAPLPRPPCPIVRANER